MFTRPTHTAYAVAALALAAPLLASPAARADGAAPKAGEIAVSGTVQKVLPHRTGFVLLVGTLTRPDGTATTLDPPRPKTVTSKALPAGLKPGAAVTAVGKDLGVGKSLPARLLSLAASAPPLSDPAPEVTPAPVETEVEATPTPTPAAGALPAPWQSADIGKVGVPGSASYAGGTFTVTASGDDMFGQADSFRFVAQRMHGDGQITARVVQYERKDQWTKVGVMVRETTDPGSKFADLLVTPDADKGAEFQWRTSTGGDTQTTDQIPSPTPFWVMLIRKGDTLSGYVSKDGKTWQPRGRATLPMALDALIGLCVCSHNNATTTEAKVDSVKVK